MPDNKAVVRTFYKALGAGNAELMKTVISDDVQAVCTGTSFMAGTRSAADILGALGVLSSLTKNGIDFKIVSMTAEEDRVACETEGASTLVNGKPYNNQYFMLFFLRQGKIYRLHEYMDSKLVDGALGPLLQRAAKQA